MESVKQWLMILGAVFLFVLALTVTGCGVDFRQDKHTPMERCQDRCAALWSDADAAHDGMTRMSGWKNTAVNSLLLEALELCEHECRVMCGRVTEKTPVLHHKPAKHGDVVPH